MSGKGVDVTRYIIPIVAVWPGLNRESVGSLVV